MTIAVAIRTESAVIFAADSKLTTRAVAGLEADGSPRWVEQTYDYATKVAHDSGRRLMVMVAGHANVGRVAATDFVSRKSFGLFNDAATQDESIRNLVSEMADEKRRFWAESQVPEEQWPGPTLLLASAGPGGLDPRVWRVMLGGSGFSIEVILSYPAIRLEGAYAEAYSLLYGFHPEVLDRIAGQTSVPSQQISQAAIQPQGWLRPIDKLSFWAMPLQDAIDMAVFIATVQVEMDRFLPGTPACGGPIDVMVLRTAPEPGIVTYPGKELHHPRVSRMG